MEHSWPFFIPRGLGATRSQASSSNQDSHDQAAVSHEHGHMAKLLWLTLIAVALGLLLVVYTGSGAYETAPYTVDSSDGKYEIRKYPELKVAATAKDSDNDSFMRLFRYIDGANEAKESISMTTPVFMEAGEMQFVVPEKNKNTAPAPSSEKVQVKEVAARTVAVYRFRGWRSDQLEKESLEKLQSWMKTNGIRSGGNAFFAYYDPPWTPGPMRRNEVLIPVEIN